MLSTLHTNDAPATITRLLNMGIEPFLVTASREPASWPSASRRKVCAECKQARETSSDQALIDVGCSPEQIGDVHALQGRAAASTCNDTGYKGRVALYEVMPLQRGLKEMVLNGASAAELKAEAIRLGMKTLRAWRHQEDRWTGVTTLEEVVARNTATGPILDERSNANAVANLHQLLKAMVEKGASRPPHHHRLAAAAAHRRRARAAQDCRRSRPSRPSSSATRC